MMLGKMLRQIRTIRGGLAILLLCISHLVLAQNSVADYERSLEANNNGTQVRQDVNSDAISSYNFNNKNLIQKLHNSGWDVKRDDQGNLILRPQKKSVQKVNNSKSREKQWQELKSKFQAAGWGAEVDPGGSIRLTPPAKPYKESTEDFAKPDLFSFRDMQQKLKDSGWEIHNNSDGSIFLFPPQKNIEHKLPVCMGTKPGVAVSLPVNSWQDAYNIARHWLQQQSVKQAMVGKIRKIFNIYLISIVSDKAPFALKHQIAIRRADGQVLVLN